MRRVRRRGYAVAILDLGACPPAEAVAAADRPRCSRLERSYWKSVEGRWKLLTDVPETAAGCELTVLTTEPSFPRGLCR